MAAVVVPRQPPHRPHQHSTSSSSASSSHSPFRRVHRASYAPSGPGKSSYSSAAAAASSSTSSRPHHSHHTSQPTPPPTCIDTFYGHEDTSKICSSFVSHTFQCPETLPAPPSSNSSAVVSRSGSTVGPQPPQIPNTLAHFVAYALHRTRLHASVVFTALALLHRLKSRFPAARGSSGHRLFLAAYMLASKVVCDDTYSNKSWAVVGQGMFALREINQMEREMLGYLEWNLNVPGEDLGKFEKEVRKIYGSGRDRESWGRGVEIRLLSGVGGMKSSQEDSQEESASKALALPSICANVEKSSPHQLPTPTETGSTAMPIPTRHVLPPIATDVQKAAYPSPPTSPTISAAVNAMCDSDSSSTSTSPIDGESDQEEESDAEDDPYPSHRRPRLVPDQEGDGSPSPTSSEESATLPTPPNSALSAASHHRVASHIYGEYPQKMGKSHSMPGFTYPSRDASGREHIGRSSAPPVAVLKREPVVSSVTASHFGSFTANIEEDGDAVMDLEDEKRGGISYYATVHNPMTVKRPASTATIPTSSRASASTAARKDLSSMKERERDRREPKEGVRRERERSLRTYTVPCAW